MSSRSSFSFPLRHSWALLILGGLLLAPASGESRPQVALVLGGGGARGMAHIGVLKVLEEEGIPIDLIVGTSFGAVVGGLYAAGLSLAEIERVALRTDWNELFNDVPERRFISLEDKKETYKYFFNLGLRNFQPVLPRGISGGQRVTQLFRGLAIRSGVIGEVDFNSFRIPFRAVATDLSDGQPFVFERGDLATALRASISFPIFFTPLSYQGRLLVDGALSSNIPVDVARGLGADFVIAVNVSSPMKKAEDLADIRDIFYQALNILISNYTRQIVQDADLLIVPPLTGMGAFDFSKASQGIADGEQWTLDSLESLRTKMAAAGISHRAQQPTPPEPQPLRVITGIAVEGNDRVPDDEILEVVDLEVRQPFQLLRVLEDVERIRGLGLFQSVDFSTSPRGDQGVALHFQVQETSSNRMGVGLRYDLDYQFLGQVDLRFKNVLGSQSELFFTNLIGNLKEHRAGLRSPRFLGTRIYAKPTLFFKQRERLVFADTQQISRFLDSRVGGELVLGIPILNSAEVNLRYSLEQSDIFGGLGVLSQEKPQLLAGFSASVFVDTLDDFHFPKRGSEGRFEAMISRRRFGSDFNYNRFIASLRHYVPVRDRHVVFIHGFLGESRGTLPFFEQFYLGGVNFTTGSAHNFYGFRRDEFQARNMGAINLGYRHRIFEDGISLARGLYLGFNYSFAGLKADALAPDRIHLFHGAGFGVYVDTLFGPVRLDAGVAENGRANIYFSVGPRF